MNDTKEVEYEITYKRELREFPEDPRMFVRVLRADGLYDEIYNPRSIKILNYKKKDRTDIIVERWVKLNLEDEITETFRFKYVGKTRIHATLEKTMVSVYHSNIWYNLQEYENISKEAEEEE